MLSEVEQNQKAYLMVTEDILKKYGATKSNRVYLDLTHDWYFDTTLLAFESNNFLPSAKVKIGKTNNCLSRRMFPALGKDLMLKKCSLYDELGKSSYFISDINNNKYIKERSTLCERCIKYGLHRIE